MLLQQMEILELSFTFFSSKLFNNRLNNDNTIITIQSKGKLNCYGWCTIEPMWYKGTSQDSIEDIEGSQAYYEINIASEYLNRSFYEIMETLLHEMVHLDNALNGIEDCSSKQFHNQLFKEHAESIGLIVEKVKRYGWSNTSLNNELKHMINNFVNDFFVDISVFNLARIDKPVKKVAKVNKKIKMTCSGCNNIVTCDEEIPIICKSCGIEFVKK